MTILLTVIFTNGTRKRVPKILRCAQDVLLFEKVYLQSV